MSQLFLHFVFDLDQPNSHCGRRWSAFTPAAQGTPPPALHQLLPQPDRGQLYTGRRGLFLPVEGRPCPYSLCQLCDVLLSSGDVAHLSDLDYRKSLLQLQGPHHYQYRLSAPPCEGFSEEVGESDGCWLLWSGVLEQGSRALPGDSSSSELG